MQASRNRGAPPTWIARNWRPSSRAGVKPDVRKASVLPFRRSEVGEPSVSFLHTRARRLSLLHREISLRAAHDSSLSFFRQPLVSSSSVTFVVRSEGDLQ